MTRAGRRSRRPCSRPAPRTAPSCDKSCNNSRSARVNVRFVRSPKMLHGLSHDPLTATARNSKTAGHTPVTAVSEGGQGRGRTADLPIFSRTLVPTELPGRAQQRRIAPASAHYTQAPSAPNCSATSTRAQSPLTPTRRTAARPAPPRCRSNRGRRPGTAGRRRGRQPRILAPHRRRRRGPDQLVLQSLRHEQRHPERSRPGRVLRQQLRPRRGSRGVGRQIAADQRPRQRVDRQHLPEQAQVRHGGRGRHSGRREDRRQRQPGIARRMDRRVMRRTRMSRSSPPRCPRGRR